MFERFTGGARTVVVQAQEHSRRLGHRYIGCEHLLLAAACTGEPASAALHEHGVTPAGVEAEIVRLVGLGRPAGLFSALDREALAYIGIDLDTVQEGLAGRELRAGLAARNDRTDEEEVVVERGSTAQAIGP